MTTLTGNSALDELHAYITAKTGLVFTKDRLNLIIPVCEEMLAETSARDLAELSRNIQADQALLDTLLNRITIPESYFFRDPQHFDFISQRILPELKPHKNADAPVKLWSAGCAAGEEAYSLAIMMEQSGWLSGHYQILASDISRRALHKARKGVYSSWSFRGARAQALQGDILRYQAKHCVVPDHLLQRVEFFYLNLASADYRQYNCNLTDVDVILCRNVFIYFNEAAISRISQQLFNTLAAGGYLILGPSDPIISDYAAFDVIRTEHGLVYRKPNGQITKAILPPGKRPVRKNAFILKHQSNAAHTSVVKAVALRNSPKLPPANSGTVAQSEEQKLITTLYQQAIWHLDKHNLDQALVNLRQVLYLDNNLAEAHFTTALLYLKKTQRHQALIAFREVLRVCNSMPPDRALALIEHETAESLALAAKRFVSQLASKQGTKL